MHALAKLGCWTALAALAATTPVRANVSANKAVANGPNQAADTSTELKLTALDSLRNTVDRRLQATYPAATRVSIYLNVAVKRFILEQATLSVDHKIVKTRDYSEKEALALLEHGTDRLVRFNATPGKHHLHIKYSGYLQGSTRDKAPVSGEIDLDMQTKPNAQAYILPVAPAALSVLRTLATKPKKHNWKWKAEAQDPRLDYARFLSDTQGPTPTLMALLEIAGPSNNTDPLPAEYQLLIAQSYIKLGLPDKALAAIRQAWGKVSDRAALAETSLRLAQLDYELGNYLGAEQLLQASSQDLAPSRRLVWQDLLSRALLAQGKYAQAATVLTKANQRLDNGPKNQEQFPETTLYLRYNYAIALIKSGQTAAGRTLLDRVGQASPSGKFAQAVRDHANLVLAFDFLHNAQGATAKSVFERLPRSGHSANLALLGLGWAELAPAGSRQAKGSPDTNFGSNKDTSHFAQASVANGDAGKLTSALGAWNTLAQGDITDPAVQQVLLAIPGAMERHGDYEQAAQNYQHAADVYTRARKDLQARAHALTLKRNGQALPAITRNQSVGDAYAGYAYQMHFNQRRQLAQLRSALMQNDGPQDLASRLKQAEQEQLEQAHNELEQAVNAQLQRLDKFEIDARLGLARAYQQASNNAGRSGRTQQASR